MDFNKFKNMYAELMMNYQAIEHDIKFIYYFMIDDQDENNEIWEEIRLYSLRKAIEKLRELDNSDDKPVLTDASYNLLMKLNGHRNHWAHETFQSFMYEDDFINSNEYHQECKKLKRDHDSLEGIYKQLEKIRVDYCTSVVEYYEENEGSVKNFGEK